jgi:uroporphyrinogen-III synthase
MLMDHTAHTLLWFRPLSPLNYALPPSLASMPWAATRHIPIDCLQPSEVSTVKLALLNESPTWLLSSPTAAHLAATFGNPSSIAVMGSPTQTAWREAGGAEPKTWFVSPTGESMGLLTALLKPQKVCILRGQEGRNDLIQALVRGGVEVNTVAVYEKTEHAQFSGNLNTALTQSALALYFSSADQPERVLQAVSNSQILCACPVLVAHERIAVAAQRLGFQYVRVQET